MLYGTASQGGTTGRGTIFKINTDGTGFSVLYTFTLSDPDTGTNGDGAFPLSGLLLAGNTLYGTTSSGGSAANGTVFKIDLNGNNFATLHSFSTSNPDTGANSDGASPWAGLILSGTTLYRAASRGGDSGSGTVFKLGTDGGGFTKLHSFTGLDATTLTNSDGAFPLGGLALSGNTLYGTAYRGGSFATGTVYKVDTDGANFAVLQHSDGGPRSSLVIAGDTLYGTTESGGSLGNGTVFKLNINGTGFTNLQVFSESAASPWAGVTLSGNILYGTTLQGGSLGQGSVFQLNTDGSGFINLHDFSEGSDGAKPQAALLLSGGNLYGTASEGGTDGDGTVFALSLTSSAAQNLAIALSGGNVIITWPTNVTGLTLQSATTSRCPYHLGCRVARACCSPGQYTVTNQISGSQRFYRLGQ